MDFYDAEFAGDLNSASDRHFAGFYRPQKGVVKRVNSELM